ncbi:MAG: MFS transporter [Kiritimatiellae bacterium]|jgi:MFS family permease|nr:MFS transporter [Kiritimatiellia bacterium]
MGRWYRWAVVALLSGAYFFHQADRAIFGVLLPYVQADLSLTDRQLGHINTVLFLTIAVVTFVAGFLGDRFSRKWIITGSLVFWSIATMGLGFASSFTAVILLRSVATGGGESFYGPSAMSLLASHHRETRSLAFSIHQAALYAGLMLSGVLALKALGLVGSWHGVFVVFGAAGLLLGIAFIWLLKDGDAGPSGRRAEGAGSLLDGFKAFFGCPSALLATTGFIAICCVNNTYITWAPKMFHERFGLDGATAGAHAMFYHHLVAFAAILFGGWVTDRLVARYPRFRLGFQIVALLLGAPALLLVGRCGTFAAAMAMTAAYGLFRGLFEVNTHASVFDVVPARHRASVVGFMLLLAMGLGALFSGELMGWVFSSFGDRAYSIAFSLMAATYALAALMMSVSFFFTFRRDRIGE